MKILRLADPGGGLALIEADAPRPKPAQGEVLVRVYAAGVTPSEIAWYPTRHTLNGEPRTGAVPAHEFSGEIAGIGEGIPDLAVGQQVYGMNDWFADGALAEFCVTRPEWIAPKPRSLSHAEAASVPVGALTAWQGLFEHAQLQAGDRVLVHGGAGSVGLFAVQLAHSGGARVITTVSRHNIDFVKAFGADEVIDYRAAPFENEVRDIDIVFDTVGGETLRRSWQVLKPGGRMVTIAAGGDAGPDERTRSAFFIVEARRRELAEIAGRLDAGALRPAVDTVLPWPHASDAYTGKAAKKGRGKLVVAVVETGGRAGAR